jgi:hypothetical protein
MDNIDWGSTALLGGGFGSTLLACMRYMVGLYQEHARRQQEHDAKQAAEQREHERSMAARYEALMREMLTGFREIETATRASMSDLSTQVGELGHAVEELRAQLKPG